MAMQGSAALQAMHLKVSQEGTAPMIAAAGVLHTELFRELHCGWACSRDGVEKQR